MTQNQVAAHEPEQVRAVASERRARLPLKWRRLLLAVHLTIAVSVLGTDLSLIALSITALTSSSPNLIRGSYVAMNLLAGRILLPLAFGALVTGVLLALLSAWRLTRYYWVLAKLALTTIAVLALVFVLRPRIEQVATTALQSPLEEVAAAGNPGIVVAIAGALLVLFSIVLISVYKPWGRIRSR